MRTLIFLLAISRLTTSSLLPYHGVTIGITPYSAPVQSQYHTQDNYGQYVYGYASGLSAKDEIKTADGVTRGGYSYIDANGILQSVQYVSDPINGFRVSASNIPRDLPEVALAKAQHFQAFENIKAEHAYIAAVQARTPILSISPVPVNGVVVPISAARVAPVAYVPQATHYTPVPVSNQYHAQDKLGQYTYGYAGPLSSKSETKTADGVTRGGYSYIDANGILQSVQYVSDPVNGFRVQATNLPEAPAVTLIGPKVTTSVVGPKDDNTVVNTAVQPPIEHSYPPQTVIPLPVRPQNIPVDYNPTLPGGFVNPVVLSDTGNQPILTNPPVLTEADRPINPGNDAILSRPTVLTNPIHTVPFPSNGHIATHGNLNLLGRPVPVDTPQNPVHQLVLQHASPPVSNQNIDIGSLNGGPIVPNPNLGYHISSEVNLGPNPNQHTGIGSLNGGPIAQDPNLGYHTGGEANLGPNSNHHADIGSLNGPVDPNLGYHIGEVNLGYQGGLQNVPNLVLPNLAAGGNFQLQNPNGVLINNAPNYQIPVNPEHGVAGAISKDLINGGAIDHGSGVLYQGQGPFVAKFDGVRADGVAYGGSIPDGLPAGGPALFIPRQQGVQQVQQTPVSALQPEQQAEEQAPAHSAPGGQLNNQPHVQGPSGYYTQNTQF